MVSGTVRKILLAPPVLGASRLSLSKLCEPSLIHILQQYGANHDRLGHLQKNELTNHHLPIALMRSLKTGYAGKGFTMSKVFQLISEAPDGLEIQVTKRGDIELIPASLAEESSIIISLEQLEQMNQLIHEAETNRYKAGKQIVTEMSQSLNRLKQHIEAREHSAKGEQTSQQVS